MNSMAAIWIPKRLVEVSLINTAAASAKKFISHCEIEYESRCFAAAGEILDSGCRIVMLTGPSASGKTTTAHKIAQALTLRGCPAKVVSLDNFYRNLEDYPRLPDGSKDYENVTALDIDEINRCLKQLLETGAADLPIFDFPTESRLLQREHLELDGGVCIVEGIHGKHGGYRLNRPVEEYSVGSILRLTEGDLKAVGCDGDCGNAARCFTRPMWNRLNTMVDQFFDGITLADLLNEA